jgi:subtilase family serine protease
MSVRPKRLNRTAVAATCMLSGLLVSGIAVAQANTLQSAGEQVLPGSVATKVVSAAVVGNAPSTQNLTIQLWLRSNQAGSTDYANAISDPHSANFHHYLSPNAYTARFGPSQAATNAVQSWLRQQGFSHVSTDMQRNYVQATAPVSTIQTALQVQLKKYAVAGSAAQVTSNDRNVTLPVSIAGDVLGISGLNNTQAGTALAAPTTAEADNCSSYYGQNLQNGLSALNGSTVFPTQVCGYTGTQLRDAYGMNATNTGKGVTVAYVENGTPYKMVDTLTKWAAADGLPAPLPTNYSELSIGSGAQCGNPGIGEEQLDIEAGHAMAPDQHQLLVGADTCAERQEGVQVMFDASLAVLNGDGGHPLATIASNSWELQGETLTPAEYIDIAHSILLRAAGEGVGMYYSSGDNPGVLPPSSDPYALAVGGTSMAINSSNQRVFETGWSNGVERVQATGYADMGIAFAAGGGTSLLWAQPSYQKSVVPPAMSTPPTGNRGSASRAVPDISALADPTTGMSVGMTGMVTDSKGVVSDFFYVRVNGGTSLAAPLVAGMVAAAEQGQPTSFGFINPLLYSLAGTSALHDILPVTSSTPTEYRGVYCADKTCVGQPAAVWTFDDQPKESTNQVTAKGYDTMTGLGTPNGQAFVSALRKSEQN